jgi:hypothetical protein
MSVTILSTILERRDTTEAWEYVNPILADKEAGFETDVYGTPIGMKIGDGIRHWDDLPYWFTASLPPPPAPVSIIGGTTSNPLTVPYVGNSSTGYTLRRADGSFDWNTSVTYDGSQFVITGDDDGSGHFSDSLTFAIKP